MAMASYTTQSPESLTRAFGKVASFMEKATCAINWYSLFKVPMTTLILVKWGLNGKSLGDRLNMTKKKVEEF